VTPDFLHLFFFFKQLLLVPVDKPRNDLNFFRIFSEIFDFPGASPVSLTLTLSINGVNDTGNACIAGVIDTGEVADLYCLVSMTLVMHDVTGVNDTGDMLRRCHWHRQIHASPVSMTPAKLSKTVKVSLTGVVDTGEELLTGVNDTGNVVDASEALK
jgi:hypothetical protein